jgi:hypothetical protein
MFHASISILHILESGISQSIERQLKTHPENPNRQSWRDVYPFSLHQEQAMLIPP